MNHGGSIARHHAVFLHQVVMSRADCQFHCPAEQAGGKRKHAAYWPEETGTIEFFAGQYGPRCRTEDYISLLFLFGTHVLATVQSC